ncbi:hypothetical protein [Halomicronema sp. CCY15110]|uniref:hypothetical protein n=1 Tax=Halomicronema sp. CCY15110 TaxID=2767773 RepID=UPI001951B006|nr:hypothetical protein [Halomicronema sp. CCY15110]
MNASPSTARRSLKRYLLPFVLLLSFGLHGMILFLPTAPGEDELVSPPDPEEGGITVTKTDPPTSQRQPPSTGSTEPPKPADTGESANAEPRINQSARAGAPNGNPAQESGGARARATGANSRASNRNATTTRGANSTPTANQSNRSPQDASRATSAPVVPRLNNPNLLPPEPNSGAGEGRQQFLSYVDVFATYQGLNSLTTAEVTERKAIWLSSFTEQGAPYSRLEIQPLAAIEPLPYEAKICLPNAPDTAELLVLVEADGTVNSDIMTLQSTGYRKFNQAARALVQQQTYPSTDHPQAYLVQVKIAYDPEECQWPPRGTNLPASYFEVLESYISSSSTTLSEAQQNQTDWLNSMVRNEAIANAQASTLEDFPERVAYPNNICLPIEPAAAQLGVVVNADGRLQGEPQQLRSTGYAVFDDRATALVKDFEFPKAATSQAYVVVVPTAYNSVNCQPLTSQTFDLITSNSILHRASPN